jgi:GntR family transcriptional regulator
MGSLHPPISQRLHEELKSIIERMSTGERLPSEPELARQLGVSRATLREVMRTFEAQGLIHRRQGSGTFVSKPSKVIESGLEVLESIETLANRIGLPVSLDESTIETRPATIEEADLLEISPGDLVTCVSRVILAEGQPAAYLVDIFPSGLLERSEIESNYRGSVLDLLLSRQNPPPASSRCEIRPVTASSEIARALEIQRGDVLLCFESLLYSRSGKVMDYSFSYFLPGYFRFHVVRRVG